MPGKRLRPTDNPRFSPFPAFGEKIGSGQDNFVRNLPSREAGRWVVKISMQKGETLPTAEDAMASTLYKKKKYEILKTFLGEFIPASHFVVGHKTDGLRDPQTVYKSYTVQERVPDIKIYELSEEQRQDPRLLRQMYVLLLKLHNMYDAVDRVNEVVGSNALDGKLDLGGISKYARQQSTDSFDAALAVSEFQKSKNLLVDPASMRLYCVDFDDGVWTPEKEAAKGVLEHLALGAESQNIINMRP